ncbi:hypothetical protein GCM10020220_085700 [Nonomuraea rubra]
MGLAANGQAGWRTCSNVLRNGIDSALAWPRHASVHDLTPSDVSGMPARLHTGEIGT